MGLSHHQQAKLEKRLNPKPDQTLEQDTPVEVDRSGFMDPEVQRGFPICGQRGFPGGATMRGTRPGDPTRGLHEAGTLILRSMLRQARGRT